MSSELNNAIKTVKLKILSKQNSAFISSMLYNLTFVENPSIDKIQLDCSTEGEFVHINPEWFLGYETNHQASILVHEVLHYAMQHDIRRGPRDEKLYQKACDQVVNNLLLDMEYELPEEEKAFTQSKFKNMSLEAVYNNLEEEEKQNQKNNKNNKNGSGSGSNNPNSGSSFGDDVSNQSNITQTNKNKRNQQLLNADAVEKMQSNKSIANCGQDFEQLFKEIKEGKLDWRTVLAGFVDEITQNEVSYHQFNRRYLPMDLYFPDTKGIATIGKIALAFDVSGSVSEEETEAFLAEIKKIKDDINPEIISVTTFNHKIVDQFEIKQDEPLDSIKMRISGGTALTPVFNYYNSPENQPNFLIVFSDMYVDDFPEKTPYPVIWVSINNPDAEIPFGKVIHITSKELTENEH